MLCALNEDDTLIEMGICVRWYDNQQHNKIIKTALTYLITSHIRVLSVLESVCGFMSFVCVYV